MSTWYHTSSKLIIKMIMIFQVDVKLLQYVKLVPQFKSSLYRDHYFKLSCYITISCYVMLRQGGNAGSYRTQGENIM